MTILHTLRVLCQESRSMESESDGQVLMSLEEYIPCQTCGGTAHYIGLEQTPTGIRRKSRCGSCGWQFYGQ